MEEIKEKKYDWRVLIYDPRDGGSRTLRSRNQYRPPPSAAGFKPMLL